MSGFKPHSLQTRRSLKQKLRSRKRLFGGWTSFCRPAIAEAFCSSGMDFVGIDIEHTSVSLEDSEAIIIATQSKGAVSLPRVSSHCAEQIKRQLDAGGDGIIVPMVNTHEELSRIVDAMKYTPVGKRSYGVARAQGYGFNFDQYVKTWNQSSVLIIQIESIQGVQNINSLLDNDQVDGVMIGPYDMSGSLGIPGQVEHPRIAEACAKVVEACKKYGRSCGTQIVDPTIENVSRAFKQGHTFVILSSDLFLLWKWGEKMTHLMAQTRK